MSFVRMIGRAQLVIRRALVTIEGARALPKRYKVPPLAPLTCSETKIGQEGVGEETRARPP